MTKRRSFGILIGVAGLVAFIAVYQNCTGSHYRTADLSISSAQVQTYIQDLQCSGLTLSTVGTSAVNDISTISSQDGAQSFFVGAPGMGMGDNVGLVANLDYGDLRPDAGGTPVSVYGNFVLGSDGTATLVIGVSDTAATTATAAPTVAPTTTTTSTTAVTNVELMKRPARANAKRFDTTSACTATNPLSLTTMITAVNDGSQGLDLGSFSDSGFDIDMSLGGTTASTIHIHSNDVNDGSLADTIQLEIYQTDATTGENDEIGILNLTQPSD